jgi:uncharacterized protein (DUF169 family)
MELVKQFDEMLKEYIKPLTSPIAVKLLQADEEFPEKARRPAKIFGYPIALCQGIGIVRRFGWTLGFGKGDNACGPSLAYLGCLPYTEKQKEGGIVYPLYAKTLEAGKRTEEAVGKLEEGTFEKILLAPLSKANFVPDVVLVYGNPGQIVRLVQGANYVNGGYVGAKATGRAACISEIATTFKSQDCNLTIPGAGEKVFALTSDDEIIFSAPYNKLADVIEGVVTTHKSGIGRFPWPIAGIKAAPTMPGEYKFLQVMAGIEKEEE